MEDLKLRGKSLTFNPACMPTKTKTGRFLTGRELRQPFAKRLCVSKQFTWKFQSYIKVVVYGNMYGVRKYDHIVPCFRELLGALVELEPSLVIIPYPDCPTTKTSRPFSKDCSMLSNTTCVQIYVDELYAAEEKPTTVKLLVGYDTPSTAFNSLEFSRKAGKSDSEVRVCTIQANTVVTAGYFLGLIKTMYDIH